MCIDHQTRLFYRQREGSNAAWHVCAASCRANTEITVSLSPWEQSGICLHMFINWCNIPCRIKATLVAYICNVNLRCSCSMCKHRQACLYASSAGYKVGQMPKFIFKTCTVDGCSPCHHIFTWLTSNQGTKLCFAQNQFVLTLEKAQRGRDCSLS